MRPVTYWMWKSNHARTRTSPFMQTSGLRDYRTRHGKAVRLQPFVYCGLQREGRCMNIWGEDGNGFTVEILSYVTMLSAHVYLSLNSPLFSAACTIQCQPLSYISNGCLHSFQTCHQRQTPAERETVHPKNMEFARHRHLRCLCILVQPLPLTWRN